MTNFFSILVKRVRTGVHQDPVRDWLILITVSAVILVGIIAWNVWTFKTLTQRDGSTSTTGAQQVFSRATLDTIQTIFDSRAAEQAKYVTGEYHFTDPSQ